ncbi:hypothetical protein K443DRAFT_90454, partial [Laccaria amethystina LaAM-08-1]
LASDTTSNATTLLWSTILKEAQITGRSLFEEDRHTIVNAEVNATRKDKLVNHKQHVGLLRSRLKAEWGWEELGDCQKEWEEKAKKMKSTEQDGLLYCDANYKIGNARFHVLIDVTDEGLTQIPFEDFNEEYAKVAESWLECSQATVSFNCSLSTLTDREVFRLDSMRIPIFPPIAENTTTPDELRQVLINFIQAQWEYTHMAAAVPDIPWFDDNFTSYLAPSVTTVPNPSTATITSLYDFLSMIKARQTDNSGVVLFSIKKSLSTCTPQSPQPTPPSPPHTSTSGPPSQMSANATFQTAMPSQPQPQPQLTKKRQLSLSPASALLPHSQQRSADAGDGPQPHHSGNVGDDSRLPQPARSSPHSPVALVNVVDDPQPPSSPLTPIPSVWGSSLTPPRDQDLPKQIHNKVGGKRKIGNNPEDDSARSKKVKLRNTNNIVPVAPSRRTTRSKEVRPTLPRFVMIFCFAPQSYSFPFSSSIKAPKPALTRTGKPAKGWVMATVSDMWDVQTFKQSP